MADTSTTAQKVGAEVIGTFVLVFFGCGTAIFTRRRLRRDRPGLRAHGAGGRLRLRPGLGSALQPGRHLGAALGGRMAWRQMPLYIGSPAGRRLLAGLMLFILVMGFEDYDVCVNGLAQNSFGDEAASATPWWAAFLVELLMTAIFLYVILAVTDARNEHPALAPAAIGLALTMIHFASINLTGTSVNPSRSIGVGVFAGTDAIIELWLFILAPCSAPRSPASPTHCSSAGPSRSRAPACASAVAAAAVPGYGAPDQFQQEWNQPRWRDPDQPGPGVGADHPGRLAVGPHAQEWKPLEQCEPAPGRTRRRWCRPQRSDTDELDGPGTGRQPPARRPGRDQLRTSPRRSAPGRRRRRRSATTASGPDGRSRPRSPSTPCGPRRLLRRSLRGPRPVPSSGGHPLAVADPGLGRITRPASAPSTLTSHTPAATDPPHVPGEVLRVVVGLVARCSSTSSRSPPRSRSRPPTAGSTGATGHGRLAACSPARDVVRPRAALRAAGARGCPPRPRSPRGRSRASGSPAGRPRRRRGVLEALRSRTARREDGGDDDRTPCHPDSLR